MEISNCAIAKNVPWLLWATLHLHHTDAENSPYFQRSGKHHPVGVIDMVRNSRSSPTQKLGRPAYSYL